MQEEAEQRSSWDGEVPPEPRVRAGPGEQSVLTILQGLSPLHCLIFKLTFSSYTPQGWAAGCLGLAQRRALAWEQRVVKGPGVPGAALSSAGPGEMGKLGSRPSGPQPLSAELTWFLSRRQGRQERRGSGEGEGRLVTAAHGDRLTPACASVSVHSLRRYKYYNLRGHLSHPSQPLPAWGDQKS